MSIPSIDQLDPAQSDQTDLVNELFDSQRAAFVLQIHKSASVGLGLVLYGGRFAETDLADQSLTLPASSTSYIEADPTTGDISQNTTSYTVGLIHLGTAVTNGTGLVSYVAEQVVATGGVGGGLGGGSLTNWTEDVADTGANSTIPTVSFAPNNAATNVDAALLAKGTGSLVACIADGSTTANGNKRGRNAVDFQGVGQRTSATHIAAGDNSIIVGGYDNLVTHQYGALVGGSANICRGIASFIGAGQSNEVAGTGACNVIVGGNANSIGAGHHSAIGGGDSNVVGGIYSTVPGGQGNEADGNYAFACGRLSLTTEDYAVAHGYGCTADAMWATARGRDAKTRGVTGYHALGTVKRASQGDLQKGQIVLGGSTTDATPTVLASDRSNTSSTGTQMQCPTSGIVKVRGQVVCLQLTTPFTAQSWDVSACMFNNGTSTALMGTPTITSTGSQGTTLGGIAITAGSNGLVLTVTGATSTTLQWGAELQSIEVA